MTTTEKKKDLKVKSEFHPSHKLCGVLTILQGLHAVSLELGLLRCCNFVVMIAVVGC